MFHVSFFRLIAGFLLSLAALCASAASDAPLTLPEAQEMALRRSLETTGLAASAAASREMAVAAGQLPDPVLRLGLDNLPLSGPDRFSLTRDFMTMFRVGVMQEITRSEKRRARSARFEREAEVAGAARLLAQTELRRNTAQAWLERHFQQAMGELLLAQRSETSLQIEAADAAYRGGRGAQADVFAARSAVAQLDDRIRQVQAQTAVARTRLARWIGQDAERSLAATPNLATLRLDTGRLEAELLREPRIGLLQMEETLSVAEVNIARSNKRADWSVELMYSQRGSAYSNMVSVGLSIPLQWDQKNRQDRELAAKLAMVERQQAQREEVARELLAQARAWLQQWQANRERLVFYDQSIIPLAAERTRAALAAYRGGASPLNAVLEARRMEIDARLDRLRLDMETASFWAQLNFLTPDERDLRAAAAVPTRTEP